MSDADLIGRTLGKRFIVRRLIGKGGMGAVYEAEHAFTKRVGALKLLQADFAESPEVVARFVKEASAAGRIGSAHIVESIDAGELETGEPYLFMELLQGSPVSDLVQSRGRLRFDEAVEIVRQAADGLAAAHAVGIVHRDVKPENLFLCRGPSPFVKILDFGISKFAPAQPTDHRITREGSTMGTPFYMSPEQAVGDRDVDARADVYALGVVLYECVTGKTPFDAETLPALVLKIYEGEYEPVSRLRPDAPPAFDAILARALARRPEDRFESMRAFREALSVFEGSPLSLSATLVNPTQEPGGVAPSLFGETLATGDGEPVSDAPASALDDRDVVVGRSVPTPRRPLRGGAGAAIALAAVAVAIAAWFARSAWNPSPASSASREPPAAVASARVTARALDTAPAEPRIQTAPSVVTGGRAPAAASNRDASASVPPGSGARPRPRASSAPGPSATSRAQRDGLTEQNPF